MSASTSRRTSRTPMGELVDLVALCSKLEARLHMEERELSALRSRGEDTSRQEAEWIRMLHRYERVCDLLGTAPAQESSPAA
ncbi:MAG TPA: hypothetical protein VHX16_11385 [Chloroflexota bacterium]|nr:hypothetical protein [Chloroflexota bacterium]